MTRVVPGATPPAGADKLQLGLAEYGRADFAAALGTLTDAADQATRAGDWEAAVQALIALGKVHRDLGTPGPALDCLGRALNLARLRGDLAGEGDALNQRAGVHHLGGEYARALEDLGEALRSARLMADTRRAASCLINIGILWTKLGDYPRALNVLTEAHTLASEALDDAALKAQVLINLGLLYEEMGDNARALRTCQDAVAALSGHGQRVLEAITTVNLGYAHKRLGQWQEAADHFARAVELALGTGHARVEIAALDGLGQVQIRCGRIAEALALHQVALDRARGTGDAESEMDALLNLGRAHLAAGDCAAASGPLRLALEGARQAGRRRAEADAHELLADACEGQGDHAQALAHHRDYHRLEKLLFNEAGAHKTRQLTIKFDLERAQHEAEVYRLGTELEREARERAEATVHERTRELEQGRDIIERQRAELEDQVERLRQLLAQNEGLRQRLVLAAQRTTTLNERFLRRLSAELHDGPAQDLGFALLRLGDLDGPPDDPRTAVLEGIHDAVQRAVTEMRAIAGGMCLPELESVTLADTLGRALQSHRRRTRCDVAMTLEGPVDVSPGLAPLPTKITLYRVVQESLNNAFKHAGPCRQAVVMRLVGDDLHIQVSDEGAGFQSAHAFEGDHGLGLLGMRERVESLGGAFRIESSPGQGTTVHMRLPLQGPQEGGGESHA